MKTYSEKLKHPKWQKKRLEILSRDEFTCQLCDDKESTLHVHHKEYIRGNEPWEYENDNFQTLCDVCHKDVEENKKHNPIYRIIHTIKEDGEIRLRLLENEAGERFINITSAFSVLPIGILRKYLK